MTKPRIHLPLLVCVTALALSAATTAATAAVFSELQGYRTEIQIDELPQPPKLAAPNAAPSRSRPPMVTMTWGSNLPVFRKPATTPAGIKSLKSK